MIDGFSGMASGGIYRQGGVMVWFSYMLRSDDAGGGGGGVGGEEEGNVS